MWLKKLDLMEKKRVHPGFAKLEEWEHLAP
jgi:hypothetical protein